MKLRNQTLGLVSLALISACGKNIQAPSAEKGIGTSVGKIITAKVEKESALEIVDGKLTGLSNMDIVQVAEMLPFANDAESGIRGLESPTFKTKGDASVGFVKATNVVFRGVKLLYPREAVKEIKKLELHLKGVRRYSAEEMASPSLADQLLCSIDGKICSGVALSSDHKLRNPKFEATYASKIFSEETLKPSHTLSEKEGLYSYSTQVDGEASDVMVIDLQKAFGLGTDLKANLDFLEKAGIPLSKDSPFRKYRFVIGNNTTFDEGMLVIDYGTDGVDKSKLPAGYDSQKPAPAKEDLSAGTYASTEVEAKVEAVKSEGSDDGSVDDAAAGNEPNIQKQPDPAADDQNPLTHFIRYTYSLSLEKLGITESSEKLSDEGSNALVNAGAILSKHASLIEQVSIGCGNASEASCAEIASALTQLGLALNHSIKSDSKPILTLQVEYKKEATQEQKDSLDYALAAELAIALPQEN